MIEICGYANCHGAPALDRDDVLAPGALYPWLAQDRSTKLLMEHDEGYVLARAASGELEFFEDDYGLGFRAFLPRKWLSIAASISRRELGCSIGTQKVWRRHGDVIELASIQEVSLTRAPAYNGCAVWCADDAECDQGPELQAIRQTWRTGYAERRPPARTGNEFIDARNGYAARAAAPRPQPLAPPIAARRHGFLQAMLSRWDGKPMFIAHRDLTRWALGR